MLPATERDGESHGGVGDERCTASRTWVSIIVRRISEATRVCGGEMNGVQRRLASLIVVSVVVLRDAHRSVAIGV